MVKNDAQFMIHDTQHFTSFKKEGRRRAAKHDSDGIIQGIQQLMD